MTLDSKLVVGISITQITIITQRTDNQSLNIWCVRILGTWDSHHCSSNVIVAIDLLLVCLCNEICVFLSEDKSARHGSRQPMTTSLGSLPLWYSSDNDLH